MIRFPLAAAALALLAACSSQPEDMTATYAVGPAGGMRLTVKAAANGEARVDAGQQVLIRREGKEYLILNDSQGRFAAALPDFIAAMGELLREGGMKPTGLGAQPDYALVKEGSEEIAGLKGDVWKVRPKATPTTTALDAVVSAEPRYAGIGKALAMQARLGAAGAEQMQGGQGNLEKRVAEMLDKGMVLRFGTGLKLEKVEATPLEPTTFALPDPVLDRTALKRRMATERDRVRAAQKKMQAPPVAPPPAPALPGAPK